MEESRCFVPVQINTTLKHYNILKLKQVRFVPVQINTTLKPKYAPRTEPDGFVPVQINTTLKLLVTVSS